MTEGAVKGMVYEGRGNGDMHLFKNTVVYCQVY